MPARLLIVEDEEPIRQLVHAYLVREGYQVLQAADGLQGWQVFQQTSPILVILDLMLPGMDGLELCRLIRASSQAYVIMLTARTEETDRVVGLEVGADDYVSKPFSPRELVARVRSALRRLNKVELVAVPASNTPPLTASKSPAGANQLVVNHDGRRVYVNGTEVMLTTLEFDLLDTFCRHANIVLSREQLIRQVWGYDFPGEERLVDVHVAQLRKKLGSDAKQWIQTIRGVGYRYDPPVAP